MVCILQQQPIIKLNARNVSPIVLTVAKPQLVTDAFRVMSFQATNQNVQLPVLHHALLVTRQIQTNALDALQELNSFNPPQHVHKIFLATKPQHVLDVPKDLFSMKRNVTNVLTPIQAVFLVPIKN